MSARAIRRAAERKALKLAKKAGYPVPAAVVAAEPTNHLQEDPRDLEEIIHDMKQELTEKIHPSHTLEQEEPATVSSEKTTRGPITDAGVIANRANAQLSTGPSEAGKLKTRFNALKTGLTGRTVLLPDDDLIAYQRHVNRFVTKYSPANDEESALVQFIADAEWRLLRIAPLEENTFAAGLIKLAHLFPDESDPVRRAALIQVEVHIAYRKEFSNYALQERRLRNQMGDDIEKLKALQKFRLDHRASQISHTIKLRNDGEDFQPADLGFDFSFSELDFYLEQTDTRFRLTGRRDPFDNVIATYRAARKEVQTA